MNNLSKSLLAVLALVVVVAGGLLVSEQRASKALAAKTAGLQADLEAFEAEQKGLREANEALHRQVSELRAAPPLFTTASQNAPVVELPPAAETEATPLALAENAEPRRERTPQELTPEQQAEREQRIAEWNQRREEFRQRMVNDVKDRREFFAQVSTEGLAPEYKASHERLLQAMGEVEVAMAAMANPDLSRDERRELMRNMGQMSGEIRDLMGKQREILLNDYAQQGLGLSPESTKQFIDYMQTVNQMTSMAPSMGGFNGRGQPRPPAENNERR
jgi:uncharacterized protein YneF (UPF0154 family)